MKKRLKVSYNAPIILSFVILCFIVTAVGTLTGNKSTEMLFAVHRGSLTNPLTYIRCFTHVFGHVGFDHFLGNAMCLLLIGPMLEEKYGSKVILKIIIKSHQTGKLYFFFFCSIGFSSFHNRGICCNRILALKIGRAVKGIFYNL